MVMSEQEILAGFAQIVEEYIGVPASQVTPETDLMKDLEIDSLSMVEIVVCAQDKFTVEIPDDNVKYLRTVRDVITYVRREQSSGDSDSAVTDARMIRAGAARQDSEIR